MSATLFDPIRYRDPDYDAACRFVAEMVGRDYREVELPPGLPGCNFCPVALGIATYRTDHDLDVEAFHADPEDYAQSTGGGSYLYAVEGDRVRYPAYEMVSVDDLPVEDVEDLESWINEQETGDDYYDFADDDTTQDVLYLYRRVPDDCMGSGLVGEFIRRFDAGEFPHLHIDTEEKSA